LQEQLTKIGSTLKVYHDKAENAWKKILSEYKVEKVFTNNDYEPYAIERDAKVEQLLKQHGASLYTFKDQ
jgi:deoxyribodipyrimidine photo-lyase